MDEKTRLYRIWRSMIRRCHYCREDSIEYKYYRGRGISVCDEWRNSFSSFKEWSFQNGYCEEYKGRKLSSSIDRINPDWNYEPANCRWITRSQNCALARKPKERHKRPRLRVEISKPNGRQLKPKYIVTTSGHRMAVEMFKKYGVGTVVKVFDAKNALLDTYECHSPVDWITMSIR